MKWGRGVFGRKSGFLGLGLAGWLWGLAGVLFGQEPDFYRDNVVIILDASGSMSRAMRRSGEIKMEAAKAGLKRVLQKIPSTTSLGLLVFSASNTNEDWVYPLGPREDNRLLHAIDLPLPGGQTPLGAYLKKGADRLLEQRQKQMGYGTYRLLVVTDGEAQDKDLVERYAPEAIARGITLDVIGVDMASRHTLATLSHSYRKADDPASLEKALAEVFAEVSKKDQGASKEEDFAWLTPLPIEVAQAAIRALAVSGNHPLGSSPADGYTGQVPGLPPIQGNLTPGQPPSSLGSSLWKLVKTVLGILVVGVVGLIFLAMLAVRRARRNG